MNIEEIKARHDGFQPILNGVLGIYNISPIEIHNDRAWLIKELKQARGEINRLLFDERMLVHGAINARHERMKKAEAALERVRDEWIEVRSELDANNHGLLERMDAVFGIQDIDEYIAELDAPPEGCDG